MERTLTPAGAELVVRRALVGYDAGIEDVRLVKHRENHVFHATGASGSLAVRLHRPGYSDARQVAEELAVLDYLSARGFEVPAVRRNHDGDHLTTVDGHLVDVFDWIDGSEPVGDAGEGWAGTAALTPEDFGRLGALAARLHNHLSAPEAPAVTHRAAWDADGLAGSAPAWGEPLRLPETEPHRALLEEAIAALRQHLDGLPRTPDRFSIIHADMSLENVLRTRDSLVLIDFDDCGRGWQAFELATLLFWYLRHPSYETYRDAALGGYAAHREPAGLDDHLLDGLLLARGLSYLGWAADRRGSDDAEFVAGHLVGFVAGLADSYLTGPTT